MTPEELRTARYDLGLSLQEMAEAMGYSGKGAKVQLQKMERGKRPITQGKADQVTSLLDGLEHL